MPHWLDSGRLQLDVVPEIVTKDNTHAVQANGLTIPGLTTRRVHAQVEMRLGEAAVVNFDAIPAIDVDLSGDKPQAAPPPKETITLFMVTAVAANAVAH